LGTVGRDTLIAEIVGRVDTDRVARGMVEAFREEIDSYHRLPDEVAHGPITDISRDNLELFLATLAEGRSLTDEELLPFRESARQRAIEGLRLEDLLHAYRLGGRLGWDALVEAATPDEQSALLPSVGALMSYIDRVSDAVTETFHDERRHLMSEEDRQLHNLFDGLLTGVGIEPEVREVAERIGFPLVDRYRPFALRLESDARSHACAQLATSLRQQGRLALADGDRVIGLAAADTGVPAIDGPGTLAIGEPARPGALTVGLEDARALLDLADLLGLAGRLNVSDHLPELLLARSPQLGAALARRALGPLDDYAARRSADLPETLEVFMEAELDRRAAADRLHVHPNTLDYRLRRIEELTGLSLSSPNDIALLALALKHRRLSGRETSTGV
jgi:hypothetical protein